MEKAKKAKELLNLSKNFTRTEPDVQYDDEYGDEYYDEEVDESESPAHAPESKEEQAFFYKNESR